MKTPETSTAKEYWTDVIPHREEVLLEDIDIFKDYLVVSERTNGLNRIKVSPWDSSEEYYLPFDSETYTAYTLQNREFSSDVLRYGYNSLTTPASVIDFNMETRQKTVMKEAEVLGGKFDKDNYASRRVWATAQDVQPNSCFDGISKRDGAGWS